jgi:small subunit ribosomal protein S18
MDYISSVFQVGAGGLQMNGENRQNSGSPGGPQRGGMRRGGPRRRPKFCFYCVEKQEKVDYKDVEKLRKYVSERGKIIPRRVTGNCAKHQRLLTEAIKRARYMALLPYSLN